MSKNDITGDPLKTKTATNAYRDGWDRIFGFKKRISVPDYLDAWGTLEKINLEEGTKDESKNSSES